MKITEIRTTPLRLEVRTPYLWAPGITEHADLVLVEVHTEDGIVGYGESHGVPDGHAVARAIRRITQPLVGQSAFDIARLCQEAWHRSFLLGGADAGDGFAGQLLAGVEMALWDAVGKALQQPLHRLLGGALRDSIQYFAFLQGHSTEGLVAHARALVADGYEVFYMKVGLGEREDVEHVAAVREAIGGRRLRLDGNERWDQLTAIRMIGRLAPFDVEFVEQPTPRASLQALAEVRRSVRVPIAADQSVLSAADVYAAARLAAADIIVLGIHETGGLLALQRAAIVAEMAGLNLCLHGTFESGITTCASNQLAATLRNLDDGNQIMPQLLVEDLVEAPNLTPTRGRLPIFDGPGLGFTLNADAVARAASAYATAVPG